MSTVDINALMQEVNSFDLCGPNLEYDASFIELEKIALGKPEVQYGSTITPAVLPDWKQVRRLATDLLERSRDLRLAVHLLRANMALYGMAGLADSLNLIDRLLDERWDSVHPQMDVVDADDSADKDATARINSLASLADGTTVLKELKNVDFILLPGLGPLSLRLLDLANGDSSPQEEDQILALPSIDAALFDVDFQVLKVTLDAICGAYDSASHIEMFLAQRVGHSQAINFDGLIHPLKRGLDFLTAHVATREDSSVSKSSSSETAALSDEASRTILETSAVLAISTVPVGGCGVRVPGGANSAITSRPGVIHEIEKILTYYEQYEPSSPVPLLLGRAKSLVSMKFMEVIEDLVPDSLGVVMALRGNHSNT